MGPDNKKRVHGTRGATKSTSANKNGADELEESELANQSRNMKIKASGETGINKDGKKTTQMKNKGNIKSQQGTGSSCLQQQQQSGQKRKQGLVGSNIKQSCTSTIKDEEQIDEVEDDIENIDNQYDVIHSNYISHNNNNMNPVQSQQSKTNHLNSQQAKDLNHNTFQSPQSLLEESKENTSECNSAQTKLRRSARNTTESKCLSSNKTTPILISPTKNARTKQFYQQFVFSFKPLTNFLSKIIIFLTQQYNQRAHSNCQIPLLSQIHLQHASLIQQTNFIQIDRDQNHLQTAKILLIPLKIFFKISNQKNIALFYQMYLKEQLHFQHHNFSNQNLMRMDRIPS